MNTKSSKAKGEKPDPAAQAPLDMDMNYVPSHVLIAHMVVRQDPTCADRFDRNGITIYGAQVEDLELGRRPYPKDMINQFNGVERVWLIYRKGGPIKTEKKGKK